MAGNITDLYVTYGSTLAPSQFHRVVTTSHVGADLNPGGAAPTYLWYKQAAVRRSRRACLDACVCVVLFVLACTVSAGFRLCCNVCVCAWVDLPRVAACCRGTLWLTWLSFTTTNNPPTASASYPMTCRRVPTSPSTSPSARRQARRTRARHLQLCRTPRLMMAKTRHQRQRRRACGPSRS